MDAVVEDEGLGALGLLLVGVQQLLLHEVIAVQPLRAGDGVVSIDAHLQRFEVDVVAVGLGPGEIAVVHEGGDGFSHDELLIVVLQRQLDVAGEGSGRDPEQDLSLEELEEFPEAVVVRLVDDDQSEVVEGDVLVVEAVVEGLHHGDVAPMLFVLVEHLHLGVDDLVLDADVRQHPACLSKQFDPVGEDEDLLALLEDEALGELAEDDGLPASGG